MAQPRKPQGEERGRRDALDFLKRLGKGKKKTDPTEQQKQREAPQNKEKEEEEVWQGWRSFYNEFFRLYRDGHATTETPYLRKIHPAVDAWERDIGEYWREDIIAHGVSCFPSFLPYFPQSLAHE
jgi:hypothetical protein